MKNIKLILLLIFSFTNLPSVSSLFESKLKIYDYDEIKFFIGDVPFFNDSSPHFSVLPASAWKSLDQYRYSDIKDKTKVWFKIDLSGMVLPFNAIYFHSMKNNLKVYYTDQIYPTKESQSSINNYDINTNLNRQIITLKPGTNNQEFGFNNIFFSLEVAQKTPLFKFFPVVVGEEQTLKEYVLNEELIKRNIDYFTLLIGNFLLFISLITLIIFLITIKSFNTTILFFSILMATAGVFYWLLSPLSLFFSDFTHTRMIYILTFYNLIWFLFGLLIASFLKKKWMALISLLVAVNLLISFFIPQLIHFNRYSMVFLLAFYNLVIIYQLNKTKLDLLKTKTIFSIAATLNAIFLVIPLFLPRMRSVSMFGPVGLGLFAWIIAFAVYTYKQYNMTINELQIQKIKNLELTESNLESQLSSLKKQLDPHFLFNSLGTLVALIEVDKECAIDYIQEFSKVYRYLLDTQDNNFVSVEKELEFCHAFVFLLKKRFNDSINTTFSINDNDLHKLVPPLSIQMLLENAIKHNIATEENPLDIKVFTDDNYLVVENILQIKKHNQQTSKLGLKNLNQRLYLLKKINIVIIESDDKFIAKIPLISEV